MKDEEKVTFRPFYISFDWVLTSPNWHWKQQKYPFLMVLATHSRLESFWCSFFSFIFISFTCHTTHCDFHLFFWKTTCFSFLNHVFFSYILIFSFFFNFSKKKKNPPGFFDFSKSPFLFIYSKLLALPTRHLLCQLLLK